MLIVSMVCAIEDAWVCRKRRAMSNAPIRHVCLKGGAAQRASCSPGPRGADFGGIPIAAKDVSGRVDGRGRPAARPRDKRHRASAIRRRLTPSRGGIKSPIVVCERLGRDLKQLVIAITARRPSSQRPRVLRGPWRHSNSPGPASPVRRWWSPCPHHNRRRGKPAGLMGSFDVLCRQGRARTADSRGVGPLAEVRRCPCRRAARW